MKNPKWYRDEIILALNLYFSQDRGSIDKNNPKVIELSKLLNKLPIHKNIPNTTTFRNPNGVSLKLSNFLAIDPNYLGKGMKSYSKQDYDIFHEFVDNKYLLRKIVKQITSIILDENLNQDLCYIEDDLIIANEYSVKEGQILYRMHKYRERNKNITEKKKSSYLKKYGKLNCEICGFNFFEFYGIIGEGFIECHHIKPLAEMDIQSATKLDDLILVCSNCHRMLHRKIEMRPTELKKTIPPDAIY